MIVLGQGDHITLGGDFEAAASTHFAVRTFKLAHGLPVAIEHNDMEPVKETPIIHGNHS